MGASTFTAIGFGPTADAAFNAARENALWENGHGGYTGTIAEKGGYIEFAAPAGVDGIYIVEALEEFEQRDGVWGPSERLIDIVGKAEAARMYSIYDDKWGPAVAIKTGQDEWTFCGWASC